MTLAVWGVKLSAELDNTNCVCSENNISFSPIVTACFSIATFVWDAATSIGSVSKTDITVSGKKLKNSDTVERMTLSPARNPSLFLKKNTLFIFWPIKEGSGADTTSPTTRSPHLGRICLNTILLDPLSVTLEFEMGTLLCSVLDMVKEFALT